MNSGSGYELLDRFVTYLIDPAVKVIFTLGLFLFLWGIVEFLWSLKDGKVDQKGKDHMIYGMAGMLIMVSVYGIIGLLMNTFGLDFDSATDASRIDRIQPGVNFFTR